MTSPAQLAGLLRARSHTSPAWDIAAEGNVYMMASSGKLYRVHSLSTVGHHRGSLYFTFRGARVLADGRLGAMEPDKCGVDEGEPVWFIPGQTTHDDAARAKLYQAARQLFKVPA